MFNPEMISIPAGTLYFGPKFRPFMMESFSVMKYPVTCSQWMRVARNLPEIQKPLDLNPSEISEPQGSLLPVVSLAYEDIQEFIARVSKESGTQFRLPSETEWEYSLKGSALVFPSLEGNTYKKGETGALTPVNAYHGNALGVADLIGNAWEYTATLYDNCQYHQVPYEYAKGMMVVRGGSYRTTPENCLSRNGHASRYDHSDTTFRLVASSC